MKFKYSFIFFIFLKSFIFSKSPYKIDLSKQLRTSRDPIDIQIAPLNINEMVYWIYKSSWYTTYGSPNGVQADFPKGKGGVVYADGIVWGGIVNDGNDQQLRVGGTTYYEGLKAGRVVYDDEGNVVGSTHPEDHHIWWIRPDYQNADLTEDAAMIFENENPTNEQIQEIYDNYAYFWENWPAEWGAPYDDLNGDGLYDPNEDIPGIPGADQTIWIIANDIPQVVDENGTQYDYYETSSNLYGSNPIGIELQMTLWGFKSEQDTPLGNTIFKEIKLKYTGLVNSPLEATINSFYISQWSDPDIGTFTDDFVGVDKDRSFGYAYNGQIWDNNFFEQYNMPAPAVGYDLLSSPTNNSNGNLSAFSYFGANSNINDPDLGTYNGSLQFYNLMLGLQPRPEYPDGIAWIDNSTGSSTTFPLSGNPFFGRGDLDGVILEPGDRRLVLSSGPLDLELGQEVEVVVALSGAIGDNHLHSVHKLKQENTKIQTVYDSKFHIRDYQITISEALGNNQNIHIDILSDGSPIDPTCLINDHEGNNIINETLYDDGIHDDEEANDNIFSNSFDLPKILGTYDVYININTPEGMINLGPIEKITTDDPIIVSDYQVMIDNLNNDGELNPGEYLHLNFEFFNSGTYARNGLIGNVIFPFNLEGQGDYFLDIPDLNTGQSQSTDFELDNSFTYASLKVPDDAQPGDTLQLMFTIADSLENSWLSTLDVLVQSFDEDPSDLLYMEHVQGSGSGSFEYIVAYPSQVTDHTYEITLQSYDWNNNRDVSPSMISGIGYEIANNSFITLQFQVDIVSEDYNYADGVRLIFPDNVGILGANEESSSVLSIISENEVIFGDSSLSGGGIFGESHILYVYIDTLSQPPLDINYIIYDDGWAQNWCIDNCEACEDYDIGFDCEGNILTDIQNAEGTITITEISEYNHEEGTLLLNLKDLNTGEFLLEEYNLPNQFGMNLPIVDGFRIYKGNTLYEAPPTFSELFFQANGQYNIDDYWQNNWSTSAMAIDTWGAGSIEGEMLSRDIQIRFTGIYEEEPIFNNGVYYYPILEGTGSSAWIDGARNYDLGSQHPDLNNPGTGDPFRLRIPFEVWDMEAEEGPQQIDITIYDRSQTMSPNDEVYAFNPNNRMYTHFIHKPYDESSLDNYLDESVLTWNLVWWETNWVLGDTIDFIYDLPIGSNDVFQFTPSEVLKSSNEKLIPINYSLSQNYPNPFNPKTKIQYSIPKNEHVKLIIFDMRGRQVRQLINTKIQAGNHFALWDGKNQLGENVSTGVYFYRLSTKAFSKNRKMILLK